MALTVVVATAAGAARGQVADTIYAGGPILTMRGERPEIAEALAVKDGTILAVGTQAAVEPHGGPATTRVDLAGRALLPGFIDTHGHLVYFGKNLVDADLFGTTTIADVPTRMKAQVAKVPPGVWIVGFGYGAKKLAENRTPLRAELGTVSTTVPVLIVDSSGHLGSGNSKIFEVAGITADTSDPAGGAFARGPDGKSLAGPMEETALNAIRAKRPPFTGKLAADAITGAARVWASFGQTTAMEAGFGLGNDDIDIVLHAMAEDLLPIDLYVAAKDSNVDAALAAAYRVDAAVKEAESAAGSPAARLLAARPDLDKHYVNLVRLGGIKFWLDGSLDTA
jgi:predicted amidohydrolase YtcJ